MACGHLSNVTYDLCDANTSIGGLRKLWLIDSEYVSNILIGESSDSAVTGDLVSGMTIASGHSFSEFTLKKNTSGFESEVQTSENATYVLTTLTIVLPKMDSAKHLAATSLLLAEAVGIALDANGRYWLLGSDTNPLAINGGSGSSGVSRDDSNNYTIEVQCEGNTFPYEIEEQYAKQITGLSVVSNG